MIIDISYITTQTRIPLTHKGDVWLVIGKLNSLQTSVMNNSNNLLYQCNDQKSMTVHFSPIPTKETKGDYMFVCDIDVKLTNSMFVCLGGNTQYYSTPIVV